MISKNSRVLLCRLELPLLAHTHARHLIEAPFNINKNSHCSILLYSSSTVYFLCRYMYSIMKASILALIVIRGTRENTPWDWKKSSSYNGVIKGGKNMTPLSHCQTSSQPTTVVSLHCLAMKRQKDFLSLYLSCLSCIAWIYS